MLAWSKLNSIESKTSEALINNEISHGDLTIINKEKNYSELVMVKEWYYKIMLYVGVKNQNL